VVPAEDPNSVHRHIPAWQGWLPWLIMIAVVMVWTHFKVAGIFAQPIQWPGLHNQVFITLYDRPYAAIWNWQPFATGTAVFVTAILTACWRPAWAFPSSWAPSPPRSSRSCCRR
jgi:L-lactate permease